MAGGGQLAAQRFGQFVVAQTGHRDGPHLGHVQMPVVSHGQGLIHTDVAAPEPQNHPVAGHDDGRILGVLGLGEMPLKQIGGIGLRRTGPPGRDRPERQHPTKPAEGRK